MARGFWTGLVHGSVLGAAGLLALSLAFPLPAPETVPESASVAQPDAEPVPPESQQVEPAAKAAPIPAVAETPARDGLPSAGQVDLPPGSEFGRGGDVAPNLPAPLSPRLDGQAEAPAVSAPPAEPAPIAITGENRRPETGREAVLRDLDASEAGGETPDVELPTALGQPGQQSAPMMVEQGGRDGLPARAVSAEPSPAPAAPTAITSEQADSDTPQAPSMPAPMPDLSLPPDLSDLRMMERD